MVRFCSFLKEPCYAPDKECWECPIWAKDLDDLEERMKSDLKYMRDINVDMRELRRKTI